MTLGSEDLIALSTLASQAAREAGALIASSRPQTVERKAGNLSLAAQVVTEIDRAAEVLILERLRCADSKVELGLLTEERKDDGSRRRAPYFWCIDPLDGTLPYVEGETGYAVSIALVSAAGVPQLGVVYVPADDVLFRAVRDVGAWRNDVTFAVSAAEAPVLAVFADRSFDTHPRHADFMAGLAAIAKANSLEGVEVSTGAGGVVNACRVFETPPACYFKLPKAGEGGGSLWDFAATACLAKEASAVATDIFGAPLDLNRPDSTFMNHRGVVYASSASLGRALHQQCLRWR